MPKPKGGRGNTVPYETKLVRIPVPLVDQVSQLVERYQEFLAEGGDPRNPPPLLDSLPFDKPVNKLIKSVNQFSSQYREEAVQKPDPPVQLIDLPDKPVNNFAAKDKSFNRLSELEDKVAQCQTEGDKLREQMAALEEERNKLRDQLDDQATRAGEWYEKAKEAQKERDELVELNHALTTELDRLEATSLETSHQLPDLEAVRNRVLSSLKVGKQAPEYKRTKATIDRFIAELRVAVGSTNNSAGATAEPAAATAPAGDRTNLTWDAKVNSFLGEVSRRVQS